MNIEEIQRVLSVLSTVLFFLFALCAAVQDLRKRSVSLRTFTVFGSIGAGLLLFSLALAFFSGAGVPLKLRALSFLPSFAFFLAAKLWKNSVGTGDALFLFTAAFYLPPESLFWLCISGIVLCAFSALCILCAGFFAGRNRGRESLPFLIFFLPAACVILAAGLKAA